jgi:hypothetical protein
MKRIEGVLFAHYETGYEGPPWAIQDIKHIDMSKAVNGMGGWSYDGLNVLEDGDLLSIYEKNKLVWQAIVNIDTDYNRRPWYKFTNMAPEDQRKYFTDNDTYHAILERYDVNLATYVYVSSKIFDLRASGVSDDDKAIESLIDSLDAVWLKLDDDERKFLNVWCQREGIPANE